MTSVEQRIVEMVFKNGSFEKNANTTIETLGKLQSALDMGGKVKGFEEIERSANRINFNVLSNTINAVSNGFSVMGTVGETVIQRITNAAIDCGKTIGNYLMKPIEQMKTGGWARASNISDAKFLIEGLGKDWEKLSEDISYAVKDTAYGFDEAAKVVAQFSATGVEAGDTMKAYARAVSGVAAMTNSSYSEIGHIFATVSGQGKLTAENMNQLANRGLNVASTLGQAMGKTEAEIRDMVSKGKISFHEFAIAMDNAFGEHAKDANKTFSGAFSNIKAALSRIGAEFATPFRDAMVEPFNAIREFVDKVNAKLKEDYVYDSVKNVLNFIAYQITDLFNSIDLDTFTDIGMIIKLVASSIGHAVYLITTAFKNLFTAGTKANEIFKGILSNLRKAFTVVDNVLSDAEQAVRKFKKPFNEVKKTVEETTEKIEETTDKIEELARAVIRGEYGNGEERKNKLADAYEKVQARVNELMKSNADLTEGNKEVTESLGEVYTSAGLTEEQINELAEAVMRGEYGNGQERIDALGDKYGVVQNKVNEIMGDSKRYKIVQDEVTESIEDTSKALDVIPGKLTFYTDGLEHIYTAWNTIKEAYKRTLGTMANDSNVGKLNNIISGLSAGADLLLNVFTAVAEGASYPVLEITQIVAQALLDAGSAIGLWVQKLHVWFEENHMWIKIMLGVSRVGEKIVEVVRSIDKGIRWLLKPTTWTPVVKSVITVKDNIKEFIDAFKETAGFKILKADFRQFAHEVKNAKDTILDKVSEWFEKFSEKKIKFPEFDATKFAEKVSDKIVWIHFKILSLKAAISNLFKGNGEKDSAFSKITSFFSDFDFAGKINKFIDLLKRAKDAIFNFFKSNKEASDTLTKSKFSDTFKRFSTDLKDVFSGADIGSKAKKIGEIIKKVGGNIVEFFGGIRKHLPSFNDIWKLIMTVVKKGVILNLVYQFNRLISAISGGAVGIRSFIDNIGSKLFGKTFSVSNGEKIKKLLTGVGIAIGAFAASMVGLASIPENRFKQASVGIMLLTGCITAIIAVFNITRKLPVESNTTGRNFADALSNFATNISTGINSFLKNLGRSMFLSSFAITVVALAGSIIALSKVPFLDGIKAVGLLGILFAMMIGVLKLTDGLTSDKDLVSVGKFIYKFSIAAKYLAAVLVLLSTIPFIDGLKGVALLGMLLTEMVAVTLITSKVTADKELKTMGSFLTTFAFVTVILAHTLKSLSKVPFADGMKALLFLGLLFAEMLVALLVVTKLPKKKLKHMKDFGVFLIMFAVAARLMTSSIKVLSKIKKRDLRKAVSALMAVSSILAALVYVNKQTKDAKSNIGNLLGIIGLMITMTASLVTLSLIPSKQLKSATEAITDVLKSLTKFTNALNGGLLRRQGDPKTMLIQLGGMAFLLAETAIIFKGLEKIDGDQMMTTAESLSTVFKAITKFTTMFGAANSNYDLSFGKIGKKGASFFQLKKENVSDWKSILAEFIGIGGLMGAIYLEFKGLENYDPEHMKTVSESLSPMFAAVGVLAAGAGQLGNGTGFLETLGSGLGQALSTGALLAVVTGVIEIIGFINDHWRDAKTGESNAEKYAESAGSLLEKIGVAIGKFIGGILGGIIEPVVGTLNEGLLTSFSQDLIGFGEGITEFFDNIQEYVFDVDKLTELKSMFDKLSEIGWDTFKVGVLEKVNSFFEDAEGNTPLTSQIEHLETFIGDIAGLIETFNEKLGNIDPSEKIGILADTMEALSDTAFSTALAAFFSNLAQGTKDLVTNEETGEIGMESKGFISINNLLDNLGVFIDRYAAFHKEHLNKLPALKDSTKSLGNLAATVAIIGGIGFETLFSALGALVGAISLNPVTLTAQDLSFYTLGWFIDSFKEFYEYHLKDLPDWENHSGKLRTLSATIGAIGGIGFETGIAALGALGAGPLSGLAFKLEFINLGWFIDGFAAFVPHLDKLPEIKDHSAKLRNLAAAIAIIGGMGLETFISAIGALGANLLSIGLLQLEMLGLGVFIDSFAAFVPHLDKLPDIKDHSDKLKNMATIIAVLGVMGFETLFSAIGALNVNDVTIGAIRNEMSNLGKFIDYFKSFVEDHLSHLGDIPDAKEKLENMKSIINTLNKIGWHTFAAVLSNGIAGLFDISGDVTMGDGAGNSVTTHQESALITQLTKLGEFVDAFADFADNHLVNLNVDDEVQGKMEMIKTVLDTLNEIAPKENGFLQWLFGYEDLENYGKNLASFGENFVTFRNTVTGVDFTDALDVVDNLVDFSENFDKILSEHNGLFNVATADTDLGRFGTIVSSWFVNISNALDENDNVTTLKGYGQKIFSIIIKGLEEAKDKNSLQKDLNSAIEAVCNAIKNAIDAHEQPNNAESVRAKVGQVMNKINDVATEKASSFVTIGENMMDGLIIGIARKKDAAIEAADVALTEVYNASAQAVESNSPSQKFINLGMYCMKGLAMGFTDNANLPESAIRKVATDSVDAMTNTIADVESAAVDSSTDFMNSLQSIYDYINYIINSSVDTVPRITPVMDLSSIQNGSYMMNKMMGANGYAFNLGNMQMNAMLSNLSIPQNDNQLIVDSINQLRADMDNLSNAILERPIVLNDGTLVGKMAPRMSTELRLLYSRSR